MVPTARVAPSGDQAKLITRPGGSAVLSVRAASPEADQSRTVVSSDPEARALPSGDHARLVTAAVCPSSVARSAPVGLQSRIVESLVSGGDPELVAKRVPSGDQAMTVTGPLRLGSTVGRLLVAGDARGVPGGGEGRGGVAAAMGETGGDTTSETTGEDRTASRVRSIRVGPADGTVAGLVDVAAQPASSRARPHQYQSRPPSAFHMGAFPKARGCLELRIAAVQTSDLAIVGLLTVAVVALVTVFYKELFYLTFDEESARAAGLPAARVNALLAILAAVTVVAAMRIVGLLLVSALMVLPALTAIRLAASFRDTLTLAVGAGLIAVTVGLTVSFYLDSAPGGTIVLAALALFGLAALLDSRRAAQVTSAKRLARQD